MAQVLPNQNLNKVPAKLKPRPIQFKMGKDFTKEYVSGLGNLPFIWFNGYTLDLQDINYLELSQMGYLPTLKIKFRDGMNFSRDKGMPLDNSKVAIFINPRSTQLKPIHIDFKITDYVIKGKAYSCDAVLDVDKLHTKEFKSYSQMSSYDALSKICKEIGLGFNSNVDSSNDKMSWINTGEKVYQFMQKLIDSSYISDQSFIMGYIDYYYGFNFMDLQKELLRNIKNEVGIFNSGFETLGKLENNEKTGKLVLTNDNSMKLGEGNNYFEKYTVINKSTNVSLSEGYKSIIKYYNSLSMDYLEFKLDSITDNSKSKIILKSNPKDKTFRNDNVNYIYKGKLDTDNMHINYSYAQSHNDRNIVDLEKFGIELEMTTPNFNLYKFQKIIVLISNQSRNVHEEYFNGRLSGEWLIIDIKYKLGQKDESGSVNMSFTQHITLVKRELDLGPGEIKK